MKLNVAILHDAISYYRAVAGIQSLVHRRSFVSSSLLLDLSKRSFIRRKERRLAAEALERQYGGPPGKKGRNPILSMKIQALIKSQLDVRFPYEQPPKYQLPKPVTLPVDQIAQLSARVIGRDYPWNEEDYLVADYFFMFPVKFVESATSFKLHGIPTFQGRPEIAFLGRSNAGKSTLLNAMVNRLKCQIAHNSSKPGRTRTINFYNLKDRLILADMMGYGEASKEEWKTWLEEYFSSRLGGPLRMLYLLLPAYDPLSEFDVSMLRDLNRQRISNSLGIMMHIPFTIVLTQIDRQVNTDVLLSNLQLIHDNIKFNLTTPFDTVTSDETRSDNQQMKSSLDTNNSSSINYCRGLLTTSAQKFAVPWDLNILGSSTLAAKYREIMTEIEESSKSKKKSSANTLKDPTTIISHDGDDNKDAVVDVSVLQQPSYTGPTELGYITAHSKYLKARIPEKSQATAALVTEAERYKQNKYLVQGKQNVRNQGQQSNKSQMPVVQPKKSSSKRQPHITIQYPGISELRWRIMQLIDPVPRKDVSRSASKSVFFESWRKKYLHAFSEQIEKESNKSEAWLRW